MMKRVAPDPAPADGPAHPAGIAGAARAAAERVLAQARAECIRAGLSPLEYAKLLLPEALLAMMVHGLAQEQCAAQFQRFLDGNLEHWHAMARGAAERCDCAIDHGGEAQGAGSPTPPSSGARGLARQSGRPVPALEPVGRTAGD